jgi:uncharacterized protein with GYD domain
MPRFLLKASYSPEGAKGLIKEGGTARRVAVSKMVEGLGGRLESFDYALGEDDAYVIVEVPDSATVVAMSMTINATGAVGLKTVELLTPEEIDAAAKQSVDYRTPGG